MRMLALVQVPINAPDGDHEIAAIFCMRPEGLAPSDSENTTGLNCLKTPGDWVLLSVGERVGGAIIRLIDIEGDVGFRWRKRDNDTLAVI